jgi:hypothetical protein
MGQDRNEAHELHHDPHPRSEASVIALLVIAAVAWLLLLAVTVGMFHIATSTSTPRPHVATPLTLIGDGQGAPDRRVSLDLSVSEIAATPRDAA